MRILIAHEASAGAGGVESYLAALMTALSERGHELAFLHYNSGSEDGPVRLVGGRTLAASVADDGLEGAVAKMRAWQPDVCFSHNMRALDVDERLAAEWPAVKMLHGYVGTCVSGQKAHLFPRARACSRQFGAQCLGLYFPRRCGQLRSFNLLGQYAWASRQRELFDHYAHVVVASQHMAAEYVRHGIPEDQLTVAPLFPTSETIGSVRPIPSEPSVLFMGRMTAIKGGTILASAIAEATRLSGRAIRAVFAGDGPERPWLQQLTRKLSIEASFPGWISGAERTAAFRHATLIAMPSLWPEPFGLAGLEAAAHGVPAAAFDVGGIREWLRDGHSGRVVPAGDARALGRVIAELCSRPEENVRLGHGAQRIARLLSCEAHLNIIERVLDRAATAARAIA
jgi:glycosyltransferase involved in cell wall biosynthesis